MSNDGTGRRYYVTEGHATEREVTKAEYVSAERRAGFTNTLGRPNDPATASFSRSSGGTEIRGRMEFAGGPLPPTPGCVRQECDHPESARPGLHGHCSHASCPNYMESCPPHATPVIPRW